MFNYHPAINWVDSLDEVLDLIKNLFVLLPKDDYLNSLSYIRRRRQDSNLRYR